MKTIVKNVPVYDHQLQASVMIDVDLEVDLYEVARYLARRAYTSKSGKATALEDGIRVTKRRVA